MAIDPICGMNVDPATARSAERDGTTYYFCSESCRKKFLTPATAVTGLRVIERPGVTPSAGHFHGGPSREFVCPMCPGVSSPGQASCPKCGMALEAVLPATAQDTVVYTCPMHPEVEQDRAGSLPEMRHGPGAENHPATARTTANCVT